MTTCKNCEGPVTEVYCSRCGQRHFGGSLTVALVREEAQGMFARLLMRTGFTAFSVLRKPGLTIDSYLGGRRRTYQEPLSYTGLALTAFFAVSTLATSTFGIPSGLFQSGALPTILASTALLGLAFHFLAVYPRHSLVETMVATLFVYSTVFISVSAFILFQVASMSLVNAMGLIWLPWAQAAVFQVFAGLCMIRLAIFWKIPIPRMISAGLFACLFLFAYQQGVEDKLCAKHLKFLCRA